MSDITAEPTTVTDDDGWKYTRATVSALVHILVNEPVIAFDPKTYPSLIVKDREYGDARFQLTVTGSAEHRFEVARRLHEVADAIAAWVPA